MANVVRFPRGDRPGAGGTLEAVFRARRDALVQYLRLRLGPGIEAEDVAQSAFLRLWEKRDALHDENVGALLFVSARNLATDILRQRRGRSESSDADVSQVEDLHPSAERGVQAQQEIALIRGVIAELPDKCRTAFFLYKFEELEYVEIARRMNIGESMVRKYVLRAVAYCATRLDQMEGWS